MIDIHSHLLPGIDDGSGSVEQSVRVLEAFRADGVTDVVLTPHTSVTALTDDVEDELAQRGEVFNVLRSAAPPVPRLHLGFEIMLDEASPAAMLADRRLTLAGSRYLLVEVGMGERPSRIAELLAAAASEGMVLVVAHPERYWHCSVADIASWRERGARLQLDATTLRRNNPRGHRARQLLRAGLADLVAADNHGGARGMAAAVAYLEQCGQADAATKLTVENPRAVIEDGQMTEVGGVKVGTGVGDFLRRFTQGTGGTW